MIAKRAIEQVSETFKINLPVGANQAGEQTKRISFLNNKDEMFMIAIPLVGVVLTVVLWFLGRFGIEGEISAKTEFLFTLVFFDSIHILFTFVLMASLPELKSWNSSESTKAKSGWMKGLSPWGRSLAVAVVLGIIFWFTQGSDTFATLRGMATIWLLLDLVGPAQHTLAQAKGISLCYNSALRKEFSFTVAEKAIAARCEKMERYLFTGLLFGEILYWIPEIFEADKFELQGVDAIQLVGGALILISATGLLFNAYYYPRQENSMKLAFLSRLLLFPLKIVSLVAGIAVRAAHGTEYLIIFKKMVDTSSVKSSVRKKIFVVTAALCLLYVVPFALTWNDALLEMGIKASDAMLMWALFLTFVLRFTHYYMDSVLFKMSDAATRVSVAPLLSNNHSK